ncbi:unnamed protein product, partial [Sphenostylis stenocarpa]
DTIKEKIGCYDNILEPMVDDYQFEESWNDVQDNNTKEEALNENIRRSTRARRAP